MKKFCLICYQKSKWLSPGKQLEVLSIRPFQKKPLVNSIFFSADTQSLKVWLVVAYYLVFSANMIAMASRPTFQAFWPKTLVVSSHGTVFREHISTWSMSEIFTQFSSPYVETCLSPFIAGRGDAFLKLCTVNKIGAQSGNLCIYFGLVICGVYVCIGQD